MLVLCMELHSLPVFKSFVYVDFEDHFFFLVCFHVIGIDSNSGPHASLASIHHDPFPQTYSLSLYVI